MDATAYIAQQTPLLRSLHAQLALPATALADDTARIDAAVRAAITSVVRSREDEVALWEAQIADGKRALVGLARAVGDKGRNVVAEGRRQSVDGEPLPTQHERLIRQTEELEKVGEETESDSSPPQQVYNERLAKIEELLRTVEQLSTLLGPPFDPPPPLEAIPGYTVPPARATGRPSVLGSSVPPQAPTTNKRYSGRAPETENPLPRAESWLDVGETVMESLQQAVERALAERDMRLRNLETHFNDLIWYHAELDLPPMPVSQPHHFPIQLLPSRSNEEEPGAHARYERSLARVMSLNKVTQGQDGDEDGVEIQGMDGIEPEMGLMNWSEVLLELWIGEKQSRDALIQHLYEKIEPLWTRLDVPQDVIDLFIESNRGSGESTIRAYEIELERVLEIRRTSLSSFVVGVRKEIAALQESLMMSYNEKATFGAFIDDEYTEDLLKLHEDEAERLRAEVELMSPLLSRVKDWLSLKADEEELERNATDPNRFKKRGPAMLREEKMRKRVEKLKPKIEAELLDSLPSWEETHGRPFLARGERVVDTISDAILAKEAAKEAKKRAKMGLAPTPAALPRHATPAGATRSQPSTLLRKREAPTPTPLAGYGTTTAKRSRTVSTATSASTRTVSSTSASSLRAPLRRLGSPTFTTPTPVYTQSRSGVGPSRTFGQPSVSANANAFTTPDPFKSSTARTHQLGLVGLAALAKADGRRPRRESFKPRQSLVGGMLAGPRHPYGYNGVEDEGLLEEDEDVF